MSISNSLVCNFFTVSLSIGLAAFILSSQSFDKRTVRLFLSFVATVLLWTASDIADYAIEQSGIYSVWRYVSSALGYTLRPAALGFILLIFLRRRSFHIWMLIPLFLNAVLAFSSYFTHWMYAFDAQNNFIRGPLGFLPHIISGLYMLLLVVISIRSFHSISGREVFTICYSAFLCVLATVIESVLWYKFLLPGAMIISCTLYFVFLYVQTYKRDELTGVLNRRSFYCDATRLKNDFAAIISVDLNGLKHINDTNGHAAGDRALRALANALVAAADGMFSVYRTGGDEFMVLGPDCDTEDTEQYIASVQDALQAIGYMASFGYAMYASGDKLDDVCNTADARMYEDKHRYRFRTDSREAVTG